MSKLLKGHLLLERNNHSKQPDTENNLMKESNANITTMINELCANAETQKQQNQTHNYQNNPQSLAEHKKNSTQRCTS